MKSMPTLSLLRTGLFPSFRRHPATTGKKSLLRSPLTVTWCCYLVLLLCPYHEGTSFVIRSPSYVHGAMCHGIVSGVQPCLVATPRGRKASRMAADHSCKRFERRGVKVWGQEQMEGTTTCSLSREDYDVYYLTVAESSPSSASLSSSVETQESLNDSLSPSSSSSSPSPSMFSLTGDSVALARILLLAAAALYGTNFSLVKLLGQTDMPVGLSSTLRFGLAALATSPWLIIKTPPAAPSAEVDGSIESATTIATTSDALETTSPFKPLSSVEWGSLVAGLEVGMWNSIAYMAQAVGLETTTASKSAFLCSLAVVVVPMLDSFVGKRLKSRQWIGAAMALVGVGFLELGGKGAAELTTLTSGDMASLLQPLGFGMAFWRMEAAMQRFPDQARRSTAAQLLAVFLGSALYCAVTDPQSLMGWEAIQHWLSTPMILGFLLWTGLITTALTIYMEALALKTLSATETTLILSTEPLWGAFFAAFIMGERFGVDAALGAALVLSGCLFSSLGLKGLQALLPGKKNNDNDDSSPDASASPSPPQSKERAGSTVSLGELSQWLPAGALSAYAGLMDDELMNDVQLGARVLGVQLTTFIQNLLPYFVVQ